jgi:hypothetical protein
MTPISGSFQLLSFVFSTEYGSHSLYTSLDWKTDVMGVCSGKKLPPKKWAQPYFDVERQYKALMSCSVLSCHKAT